MEETCEFLTYGRCTVGAWWKPTAGNGNNRLYYINGGTGGYIINSERIPFEAGKLYFWPSYANILTYTDPNDELDHSYVSITMSSPILSNQVFCMDPNTSPYIKAATDCFHALCEKRHCLQPPELELLKSISLYLIEMSVQLQPNKIIHDPIITTALDIMHSSLSEKPTIAQIAEQCHMSTNGFIKKFTKCTGETPYAYLKKLKLRTALTLRANGATVENAARATGYSDAGALLHAIASMKKH